MNDWRLRCEALEQELRELAIALSHDLRAPVRAVDGFGRALAEAAGPRLEAREQQHLRWIRDSAAQMGRQIEALVGLCRLSTTEVRPQRVDLGALGRAVIEALRAAEPGRTVDVQIEPDLDVEGDARLLRILLESLLSNAWKFTGPAAEARIRLGRRPDGAHPVFFVSDTGVGFDVASAERLFQPFSRLHATNPNAGLGLGLARARRVVARHGGRIWAESAPGAGATFSFVLGPSA